MVDLIKTGFNFALFIQEYVTK